MTDPTIVKALDLEQLRTLLLQAGYRAEQAAQPDGGVCLRSATGGLAFQVRFANPLPGRDDDTDDAEFADAVFQTVFHVQGELPLSLVNGWNATRRFGRLYGVPGALALDMDVSVLGGVTAEHLGAQVAIWDRLVQDFLAYLRAEVPKLAPSEASPEAPETPGEEDPPAVRATA